jgi:CRP/FNR family transcriptional regulator, anaerobic regulatory protein
MKFETYLKTHVVEIVLILVILKKFKPIHLEDGEYLLKKGQLADKIYFIEEGILKDFLYNESESLEVNWILPCGYWMMQSEGFILKKASETYIKSIGRSKVWEIDKDEFKGLLQSNPKLYPLALKAYDQYNLTLYHRVSILKLKKLADRLEKFEKLYPELANKIKQKVLAAYLNTTASELSRLRKNRML